jgi:hypothetical protein
VTITPRALKPSSAKTLGQKGMPFTTGVICKNINSVYPNQAEKYQEFPHFLTLYHSAV